MVKVLNLKTMKKYTFHFLVIAIISALLGFTGLEFPGDKFVRLLCLFSFIALMLSCLDAVLISRKQARAKKNTETESTA